MTITIQGGFIDYTLDPAAVRGYRLANAGAVPFTRRHRRGHWLRRPRGQTAALRAEVRPGAVPPDAWDNIPIAALSSRTWKRHRRTQWHTT